MTLPQINRRLDLYPEYLRYYIDRWYYHCPQKLLDDFRKQGYFFWYEIKNDLTFNEWLLNNGYKELTHAC